MYLPHYYEDYLFDWRRISDWWGSQFLRWNPENKCFEIYKFATYYEFWLSGEKTQTEKEDRGQICRLLFISFRCTNRERGEEREVVFALDYNNRGREEGELLIILQIFFLLPLEQQKQKLGLCIFPSKSQAATQSKTASQHSSRNCTKQTWILRKSLI